MAEAYRYTSNKDGFDGTHSVVVAVDDSGNPTKVLVKGGPAVELTEEEHARVSERFNLRKASEAQVEASGDAVSGDPEAVASEQQEKQNEAVQASNNKTSATPSSERRR